MQYKVFRKDTKDLVAWIDTEGEKVVLDKDFDVLIGKSLYATESNPTLKVKFFSPDLYPDGLQKIDGNKSDWIDLRCAETVELKKGQLFYVPLGVAIQLPKGFEAFVLPRSSTAKKFLVLQSNSIGLIDETYNGDNDQWCMPVYAIEDTKIEKGERICQFRIIEHQPELNIEVVEHLGNADRGGLGSTGTK